MIIKHFTHDCNGCEYLGSNAYYDYYRHADVVIRREGNKPEDNRSLDLRYIRSNDYPDWLAYAVKTYSLEVLKHD